MSPEQVTGIGIGPAADVFALGSTLAYAATGHGPFAADQAAATLYRIVRSEPDLSNVPAPILDVVAACLVKDPEARPTVQELAAALRTMPPDQRGTATLPGRTVPGRPRAGLLAPPHVVGAETLDPSALRELTEVGPARPASRRRPLMAAVAVAAVLVVGGVTALGVTLAGATGGDPVTTSSATPAVPPTADPDDPRLRYVDRLCSTGALLVTLSDALRGTVTPTNDLALAKKEFLAQTGTTISTVDVVLSIYTSLRDDAPTQQLKLLFGQIVTEFTSARTAFTEAEATVKGADPMTAAVYGGGVQRYGDGVRNLAYGATLTKEAKLPPEYTALSAVAPSCVKNPPPSN